VAQKQIASQSTQEKLIFLFIIIIIIEPQKYA